MYSLYRLLHQIGFKDVALVENTTILVHLVLTLLRVFYSLVEILFTTSLRAISGISQCVHINVQLNQF
jgi:hypothetical protein